jgi:mRNA interferase RelE/StbE
VYTVTLTKAAEKNLGSLPKKDQKRIVEAMEGLQANPFTGKQLQGPLEGLWSLRVWPYRIIYRVEKQIITVTVLAIGHRQGVYKKLKR